MTTSEGTTSEGADDEDGLGPEDDGQPEGDGPTGWAMLRSFAYGTGDLSSLGVEGIDPAEQYHEASKIHSAYPGQMWGPGGGFFLTDPRAAFRLGRKSLAHTGAGVALPSPPELPVDLAEVSRRRRSELPPESGPVTLAEVGTLLALTAGRSPDQPGLRVTPSAGALYPLDLIVVTGQIEKVAPGGYVYDTYTHRLVPRVQLDVEQLHARVVVGDLVPTTSITIAVVATFARTRMKYGLRGYRFALIEAGHLAQGLVTVATALGLHSLAWGGFADQEADRALELDGVDRSCVYLVSIARAAQAPA